MENNNLQDNSMESILTSIKIQLGILEGYTHFDSQLIIHINSVFMVLNQLGIGPEEGFSIKDKDDKWSDFLGDNTKMEAVKTYMYLKVRMIFDPPASSIIADAFNRSISECEWRLNFEAETREV